MRVSPIDVSPELVLSPLQLADAEELFGVVDANRAHLREWLTWVDGHKSAAVAREFIKQMRLQYRDETGLTFALRHEGALVGVLGFNSLNAQDRCGEIGYWLSGASNGRGLMTMACRALISHGFERLGLHRVFLQIATENLPSRAVAERLGCRLEGVQREALSLNGSFVDMAIYALLSEEWDPSQD